MGYAREIIVIPNDFDSIRSISVCHADGRNLTIEEKNSVSRKSYLSIEALGICTQNYVCI